MYNSYEDLDKVEINKNQLARLTRALYSYMIKSENLNTCLAEQGEQEKVETLIKSIQETREIFMLMISIFEEVLHNEN